MALLPFENSERPPVKNRFFLADSSFVIAYLLPEELEPFHATAQSFFEAHRASNIFQINFTVKLEVLRRIRAVWIKSQLKDDDPSLYEKIQNYAPRDLEKAIRRLMCGRTRTY